ncbi:nucleoside phosphorylase [Tanacetum coccineum]
MTTGITSILILAALDSEALPIVQHFKLSPDDGSLFPLGVPWIRYHGYYKDLNINLIYPGKDRDLVLYPICPLLVWDSSLVTYASIQALKPDLFINAGTAGGFKVKGTLVFDVYLVSELAFHDRRIPIPGPDKYGLGQRKSFSTPNLVKELNLKVCKLSMGDSLDMSPQDETSSWPMMQQLLIWSTNWLESLAPEEGAALAYVSSLMRVPAISIKAVSNFVDGEKSIPEEFAENLEATAVALRDVVAQNPATSSSSSSKENNDRKNVEGRIQGCSPFLLNDDSFDICFSRNCGIVLVAAGAENLSSWQQVASLVVAHNVVNQAIVATAMDHSDQFHLPDAPELDPSLEATVTHKFDMCLFRSCLTENHVKNFCKIYAIPSDLHPCAPSANFTMNQLSHEHIGLYAHHFRRGGLRVHFSTFFLSLVEYFCVHISQLTPLGINHSTIFEMYCRALGVVPTVPLFRVFYKLCKQGDWFSFQSRVGKGLKPCIKGAPTSLKKWKDKFFLIDRRAAPIAMAWRHHDSSVADVLPGPSEYNAADVATLLQVPIQLHKPYNSLLYVAGLSPTWKGLGHVPVMKGPGGKVLTMAEFLRLPDLGACKIVAGTLLPPNFPVDTHLSTPATRLEDVPLKTPAMENAEIACRKVIVARERKKQRAEEQLASKAVGKVGSKRRVAQEGTSRKRKTPATAPSSEQVSSPQPINQVVPNQPLVTGNVRESALNARLDILRDQTDEHLDAGHDQSLARDDSGPGPRGDDRGDRGERGENDGRDDGQHVGPNVEGGDENDDQNVSQHPPAHRTGGEKTVPLPFAPVWGITDSDRMVKFRHCRDMMSNIFTPADLASFEGMDDREAVRRSWKLLCQSSQQQANMLLRFEKLYDESDGLQESRDRARAKYDSCKKQLVDLQVAYDAKASSYGQLSHDYEDVLRREEAGKIKIVELEKEKKRSDELVVSQAERIKSLEIALKESETGIEQLRSDRERFAVAVGQSEAIRKGFIDGISLGRTQADVDALLNASPGVNPASSDLFMGEYLKLFETRYPYVNKLARAYLLDPLQAPKCNARRSWSYPGR